MDLKQVILFHLILALVGIASATVAYQEDFDGADSGWTFSSLAGNSWQLYSDQGINGTAGLRSESAAGGNYASSPLVSLAAGSYVLVGNGRTDSATSRSITVALDSQPLPAPSNQVLETVPLSPVWKQFVVPFTQDTASDMHIILSGVGPSNRFIYLDEISIELQECDSAGEAPLLRNGNCVAVCEDSDFLFENQCFLDACPRGSYANIDNTCSPCDIACDGCTGAGPNSCTECATDYLIQRDACVETCGELFFNDGSRTCAPCSIACDGCDGSGPTNCIECAPEYFVQRDACVETCGKDFYIDDDDTQFCAPCNIACDGCDGAGPSSCIECAPEYFLQRDTCVETCGEGFYNDGSRTCAPCSIACDSCDGSGPTNCIECAPEYFVQRDACVETCGKDFYIDDDDTQFCAPCNIACDGCDGAGPSSCIECAPLFILRGDRCVRRCEDGFFAGDSNVCSPCSAACATCTDSSSRSCIECAPGFISREGNCVDQCDPSSPWTLTPPAVSTEEPLTEPNRASFRREPICVPGTSGALCVLQGANISQTTTVLFPLRATLRCQRCGVTKSVDVRSTYSAPIAFSQEVRQLLGMVASDDMASAEFAEQTGYVLARTDTSSMQVVAESRFRAALEDDAQAICSGSASQETPVRLLESQTRSLPVLGSFSDTICPVEEISDYWGSELPEGDATRRCICDDSVGEAEAARQACAAAMRVSEDKVLCHPNVCSSSMFDVVPDDTVVVRAQLGLTYSLSDNADALRVINEINQSMDKASVSAIHLNWRRGTELPSNQRQIRSRGVDVLLIAENGDEDAGQVLFQAIDKGQVDLGFSVLSVDMEGDVDPSASATPSPSILSTSVQSSSTPAQSPSPSARVPSPRATSSPSRPRPAPLPAVTVEQVISAGSDLSASTDSDSSGRSSSDSATVLGTVTGLTLDDPDSGSAAALIWSIPLLFIALIF